MALLLDTHVLVWIAARDRKLSERAERPILDPDVALFVSAVTAWEYAELERRGRFAGAGPLAPLLERLEAETLDLPASLWITAENLPDIHRDPVDRMLIAHAIALGMTLVTADRAIHRYPVETLW